jgi:hypothetical protein
VAAPPDARAAKKTFRRLLAVVRRLYEGTGEGEKASAMKTQWMKERKVLGEIRFDPAELEAVIAPVELTTEELEAVVASVNPDI